MILASWTALDYSPRLANKSEITCLPCKTRGSCDAARTRHLDQTLASAGRPPASTRSRRWPLRHRRRARRRISHRSVVGLVGALVGPDNRPARAAGSRDRRGEFVARSTASARSTGLGRPGECRSSGCSGSAVRRQSPVRRTVWFRAPATSHQSVQSDSAGRWIRCAHPRRARPGRNAAAVLRRIPFITGSVCSRCLKAARGGTPSPMRSGTERSGPHAAESPRRRPRSTRANLTGGSRCPFGYQHAIALSALNLELNPTGTL